MTAMNPACPSGWDFLKGLWGLLGSEKSRFETVPARVHLVVERNWSFPAKPWRILHRAGLSRTPAIQQSLIEMWVSANTVLRRQRSKGHKAFLFLLIGTSLWPPACSSWPRGEAETGFRVSLWNLMFFFWSGGILLGECAHLPVPCAGTVKATGTNFLGVWGANAIYWSYICISNLLRSYESYTIYSYSYSYILNLKVYWI